MSQHTPDYNFVRTGRGLLLEDFAAVFAAASRFYQRVETDAIAEQKKVSILLSSLLLSLITKVFFYSLLSVFFSVTSKTIALEVVSTIIHNTGSLAIDV